MSDTAVHSMNRSWDYILNGPEKTDAPTQKEHQDFIRERKSSFVKRSTPAQTFSLGGAIVFALGWLFCLKSDNNSAKWITGLLAGVGAAATAIFTLCFGWSLKGSFDEQFNNKIFKIAAKEIAKHTGGNETDIQNALTNPNSQNAEIRKDVHSIEYTVEKKESSKCNVIINILLKNADGSSKKLTTKYEETWDSLPSQVRSDFLEKGGDSHEYTVYKKNTNPLGLPDIADILRNQREPEILPEGLSKLRKDMTQEELIQAATDEKLSSDVREYVIEELQNRGDKDSIEPLIKLFDDSNIDKLVMFKAFLNLAARNVDIKKAVPKLIEHFKKKDNFNTETEERIAAETLIYSKDDSAISVVIEGIKDADDRTRRACLRSLGSRDVQRALPMIKERFKLDKNPNVKAAAGIAIAKLSGISEIEDQLIDLFIQACTNDQFGDLHYRSIRTALVNSGDNSTLEKLERNKANNVKEVINEIDGLIKDIQGRLTKDKK